MGVANRRRLKFLNDHPRCCFCAGEKPTEEEDHQPARVFFKDRVWPEGFVFPACSDCNRISKESENAVSLIAFSPDREDEQVAYRNRVAAVRQLNPALLDRLGMSALEKRRVMKERGLTKPNTIAFGELTLVRLPVKEWEPHFEMVGRKLMLALHYQCFGHPLPRTGGLYLYTRTNIDHYDLTNDQALELTPRMALPRRGNKALGGQFSVRWDASNQPIVAAFTAHIQGKIVFRGHTVEDPKLVKELGEKHLLRPLQT